MSLPSSDNAGAGAAVIGRQIPARPARLQMWFGSVHAVSQHTSLTQFIDLQSLGMKHC